MPTGENVTRLILIGDYCHRPRGSFIRANSPPAWPIPGLRTSGTDSSSQRIERRLRGPCANLTDNSIPTQQSLCLSAHSDVSTPSASLPAESTSPSQTAPAEASGTSPPVNRSHPRALTLITRSFRDDEHLLRRVSQTWRARSAESTESPPPSAQGQSPSATKKTITPRCSPETSSNGRKRQEHTAEFVAHDRHRPTQSSGPEPSIMTAPPTPRTSAAPNSSSAGRSNPPAARPNSRPNPPSPPRPQAIKDKENARLIEIVDNLTGKLLGEAVVEVPRGIHRRRRSQSRRRPPLRHQRRQPHHGLLARQRKAAPPDLRPASSPPIQSPAASAPPTAGTRAVVYDARRRRTRPLHLRQSHPLRPGSARTAPASSS